MMRRMTVGMKVRIHPFFTKENNHSRTKAKPKVEPDNSAPGRAGVTPGRACIARGARMGVGGVKSSRVVSVYIHIQPLKKIQSSRSPSGTARKPSVYSRGFYHGQESNPIEINVDYL